MGYGMAPLGGVLVYGVAMYGLNPLPLPGNRDFGVGHVPLWRSPAQNPIKFGHILFFFAKVVY